MTVLSFLITLQFSSVRKLMESTLIPTEGSLGCVLSFVVNNPVMNPEVNISAYLSQDYFWNWNCLDFWYAINMFFTWAESDSIILRQVITALKFLLLHWDWISGARHRSLWLSRCIHKEARLLSQVFSLRAYVFKT